MIKKIADMESLTVFWSFEDPTPTLFLYLGCYHDGMKIYEMENGNLGDYPVDIEWKVRITGRLGPDGKMVADDAS